MEVHSKDSDTELDISSEESEDELDINEEYFFGKDKESKWRKNPIRTQIRKQPQNICVNFSYFSQTHKKCQDGT